MSAGTDTYRYERKFLIEDIAPAEVEAGVRHNPALFYTEYPPRAVNNIYFDSADLRHYHRNVDGHHERVKARIRWYGPLFGPVLHPVLEIKRKQGLLGSKETARLRSFTLDKFFSSADARTLARDHELPDGMKRELDGLEPMMLNRYQRKYFRSADRHLRLTLDFNLEFYRLHRRHNSFLARTTTSRMVVMELKYLDAASELVADVTNAFPFRMTRMSKYVFGIEVLQAT